MFPRVGTKKLQSTSILLHIGIKQLKLSDDATFSRPSPRPKVGRACHAEAVADMSRQLTEWELTKT